MLPPGRFIKIRDEGPASPFMARLFDGILELRDSLMMFGRPDNEHETVRKSFDRTFHPLFEAAEATRDAAVETSRLVSCHTEAVLTGRAVHIHGAQVDIIETVDKALGQEVDKLLSQAVVTTKTCLQRVLKDPLELDIGFLFQRAANFTRGVQKLRDAGEVAFADYMCTVRNTWHESVQDLRRQAEHEGWSLRRVRYPSSRDQAAIPVFPEVLGLPVDEFAATTANRVLTFVEESLVYAMQRRYRGPAIVIVVELPPESRDPAIPKRFKLDVRQRPADLEQRPSPREWTLEYRESTEFVQPAAQP